VYRTYSQQDFVNFISAYTNLSSPPDWALHDFGKPGDTVSISAFFPSQLQELWYLNDADGTIFQALMIITGNAFTTCVSHHFV
jgi:hypothetical protein